VKARTVWPDSTFTGLLMPDAPTVNS